MERRISLAEFAQIVMSRAQCEDFTNVISVGTRTIGYNNYYVIFCEDNFGRESEVVIPYYVEDQNETR